MGQAGHIPSHHCSAAPKDSAQFSVIKVPEAAPQIFLSILPDGATLRIQTENETILSPSPSLSLSLSLSFSVPLPFALSFFQNDAFWSQTKWDFIIPAW